MFLQVMMAGEHVVPGPSTTAIELEGILIVMLPRYSDENAAGELADVLTEMGDELDEHGTVPARHESCRAWTQVGSYVRGALDAGADPGECRELLYALALVLDRHGWGHVEDLGRLEFAGADMRTQTPG